MNTNETFCIWTVKSNHCLALHINESTTRKILYNMGPEKCEIMLSNDDEAILNGAEWLQDNPEVTPF